MKRQTAVLIPYFIADGIAHLFMQRRAVDAQVFPDNLGFFGGGIEQGETPEEAVKREIREELGIDVSGYTFFGTYDYSQILNVFTAVVDETFEKNVHVMEGQYGKFYTLTGLEKEPKCSDAVRAILADFEKTFQNSKKP